MVWVPAELARMSSSARGASGDKVAEEDATSETNDSGNATRRRGSKLFARKASESKESPRKRISFSAMSPFVNGRRSDRSRRNAFHEKLQDMVLIERIRKELLEEEEEKKRQEEEQDIEE